MSTKIKKMRRKNIKHSELLKKCLDNKVVYFCEDFILECDDKDFYDFVKFELENHNACEVCHRLFHHH